MSVDLRTEFNDADSVTGWTGQGKEALNNDTGQFYEGTGSIEDQRSNTDEETYYTAGASVDLSDSTCYMLVKDNLVNSYANGGIQFLIGDGTDTIGYDVGGYDARGLGLRFYYFCHKLDVTERGNESFAVYGGAEANLTVTAITEMGIGTLHLAKAVGSIANCWVDRMSYHANGSYALRINGGTVGTPETMADVQGDDETNGWGIVNNPLGSQYGFFAPTEWGEPAANADAYFEAIDEQWFWIGDNAGGHLVGATHFPFRVIGNATDTISFVLENVVIVNTGTRAQFDISDANVDTLDLTNVTFTNLGAISGPAQDAGNKTLTNPILNNCDQANFDTVDIINLIINGTTDADGAILLDTDGDSDNIIGATFNSDGTGHAVEISVAGTYDFDEWFFNGYGADGTTDAAVYISANVAVTINILNGGDTPTVRHSGTAPTINNNVIYTLIGVTEGTSVVVLANETVGTITDGDVLSQGFADDNGEYTFSINYEGAFGAGLDIISRARNHGIAVAAIADDGGVFTDEREEANSSVTADMTLTPNTTQAVNDAYYFAGDEPWIDVDVDGTIRMKLEITTAHGAGNPTIVWEYWDGATWSALTFTNSDPNPNWTSTGQFVYEWDDPTDWGTTTVDSQGPFYYIRARVSVAGTSTNGARGRKVTLDTTRYIPFVQNGTITTSGANVTAVWSEDTISKFLPTD